MLKKSKLETGWNKKKMKRSKFKTDLEAWFSVLRKFSRRTQAKLSCQCDQTAVKPSDRNGNFTIHGPYKWMPYS